MISDKKCSVGLLMEHCIYSLDMLEQVRRWLLFLQLVYRHLEHSLARLQEGFPFYFLRSPALFLIFFLHLPLLIALDYGSWDGSDVNRLGGDRLDVRGGSGLGLVLGPGPVLGLRPPLQGFVGFILLFTVYAHVIAEFWRQIFQF